MEYIKLTMDNLATEHICCAITEKKGEHRAADKKAWLKERLKEGLVFLKANVRGKVFIEYIDAEKAWVPIQAHNCLFINCLWVAGQYKGKGYAHELLTYCIEDAKARSKQGICVISAKKKQPYLADRHYLEHYGFQLVDEIFPYQLYYLPIKDTPQERDAIIPKFLEHAKTLQCEEDGFVLYYSCQCPHAACYGEKAAQLAKEANWEVHVHHLKTTEEAQQLPCPTTTYALFLNHRFITHEIQSEKKLKELLSQYEK